MPIGSRWPAGGGFEQQPWDSQRLLVVALAAQAPALIAVALVYRRSAWAVAALAVILGGALVVSRYGAGPRAQREQELRAHLGEAERVKSELVAVVSHEFRTPLTSIMGFAQTLEQHIDQMDRTTLMACLQSIERQARRLERIVTNVLAASGEVPGGHEQHADLATVTAAVLQDLRAFPGPGTHRIVADIEPGLAVRTSPEVAARILTNLLDNALKFATPHTEIRLRGRCDGDVTVVEVADQGPAILEEDLERIFEPFVQGDSSDTRRAEGIGLGLAIVRRLAEAHGGGVAVCSDPPWVTLAVRLPRAGVADGAPLPARDALAARPV